MVSRGHLSRLITPTTVTLACCLLYVWGVLALHGGDPLSFALLGTRFTENLPHGTEGYDGQFAYQIARQPLSAAPHLDIPAYRYQRILYPMLALLLAFGQPSLIPWTLIAVNLLAIGLGTWATEQLLHSMRANRWHALTYGLYGGQLLALRTDLNEPLAQALVQLAMLAWAMERRWGAVVAFSLAALTKETTLIFLGAYLLHCLLSQQWRWIGGLGLAGLPFVGYQLLLWAWLGQPGVGSGGAGATPFSLLPLGGWLSILSINMLAFLLISLVVLPLSIIPALAGLGLSLNRLRAHDWHPFVLSLLLNSAILLVLPQSTVREPAAMARLTQGLVAAMLFYGARYKSRRVLWYSTLWLFSGALLLNGVPAA